MPQDAASLSTAATLPRLYFATPRSVERVLAAEGLSGLLSAPEREVLDGLALERRRRDWLAGRLAAKRVLRAALRERDGIAPLLAAITILNAADGAPYFVVDGRPELGDAWNISIAHHDGFAVCGLACTAESGLVGVDLEWNRPLPLALLRYALTGDERRQLADTAPARAPTPLALWTLKEAVVKAGRNGICTSMRQVELSWGAQGALSVRLTGSAASNARITAACRPWGAHILAYANCRLAGAN